MNDELVGKRVLVVEDEPILAMSLEDMLTDLGCTVVGPALRISEAEALARSEPIDGAILDVNMGGGPSYPIADILRGRGIPFCFSTGYGGTGIEASYREVPVLQKPYRPDMLTATLRHCLGAGKG